jgi:hypothetical protein
VVGNGEIKTEQADDRADQPLGLAQRQADMERRVSAVMIAKAE